MATTTDTEKKKLGKEKAAYKESEEGQAGCRR